MTTAQNNRNTRILIIDDSQDIHEDFKKILLRKNDRSMLDSMEEELFGEKNKKTSEPNREFDFELDHALQGQEGFEMVKKSIEDHKPYVLAFVDMRMPPGWDGLETIEHLWQVDQDLQIVICSAYSDHSWPEIAERLGYGDKLLILQKPFSEPEALQIAHSLVEKWGRDKESLHEKKELDCLVKEQKQILEKTKEALAKEKAHAQRIEQSLVVYQKLKNIGQLASGIAHEIAMLSQYTSSNVKFLKNDFNDIYKLLSKYRETYSVEAGSQEYYRLLQQIEKIEKEIKLFDLESDIPNTCIQISEAANDVQDLATAMQEFDYSSQKSEGHSDINKMILTMLKVARSEYKYIADIKTELGEIPSVFCHIGDLNQVLFNLITNAIHAIATSDSESDSVDKGTILVTTALDESNVIIKIKDSGDGIPDDAQSNIFEPFFTTRARGKGSGQGLAIARSIIVNDHGGDLSFESISGVGTTFIVSLPVNNKES